MTVYRSLQDLATLRGPVVLAFGMFDGVHRGHQAVIHAANLAAGELHAEAVLFTFDPHPMRVLRPGEAPKLLCGPRHQLVVLKRAGVGSVLMCPFDQTVAGTSAHAFMEQLLQVCPGLRRICVGEGWRFGKGRGGDVAMLAAVGEERGFDVVAVPPVLHGTEVVSSTRIRHAVRAGDLNLAADLLGRFYSVFGTVIQGDQLARKLGFPTANVKVENEQLPPAGVYAVHVLHDGRRYGGVANLGHRPTITPENQELSLEAHLFDFDGDLYGRDLEVEFRRLLRAEQRFAGIEELRMQIAADCAAARAFLSSAEAGDASEPVQP